MSRILFDPELFGCNEPIASGCASVDRRDQRRRKWRSETTMAACKHATFLSPARHGGENIYPPIKERGHSDADLTEKVCRRRGKTEPNRRAPARRRPDYSLTQNKAASRPIFARAPGAVTSPAFILLSSAKHDSGGAPLDSFCCLNNSNSS